MKIAQQLAKHLLDVHFGGNWTTSNYQAQLEGIPFSEIQRKVGSYNSIESLVRHTHYYVQVQYRVLQGERLQASDEESWVYTPCTSAEEWEQYLQQVWADARRWAESVEKLSNEDLMKPFVDEKYGSMWRNLMGLIEHHHYHLGQIAILKKMV